MDYELKLLSGWEDVFKKSQLTLWILLALHDGPKHMTDIKDFITKATNGLIVADDKSVYRALRRFNDVEMVEYQSQSNDKGPDRKLCILTVTGRTVLSQFVRRNIVGVFFKDSIRHTLQSL